MLTRRQIERMVERKEFGLVIERILANGRCEDERVAQVLKQQDVVEVAALGLALQRYGELSGAGGSSRRFAGGRASAGKGCASAGGQIAIGRKLLSRLAAWLGQVKEPCSQSTTRSRAEAKRGTEASGQAEDQQDFGNDSASGSGPRCDAPMGAENAHGSIQHPAALAALAVAIRALLDGEATMRGMTGAVGRWNETHEEDDRPRLMIDRGLRVLTEAQHADGMVGDPLSSAIILWQLGAEPCFSRTDTCRALCTYIKRNNLLTSDVTDQKSPRSSVYRNGGMHHQCSTGTIVQQALAWAA